MSNAVRYSDKIERRPGLVTESRLEDEVRELLDPSIKLHNGWNLEIARLDARSDEPKEIIFDLSTVWLPSNAVFPTPQRLVTQPKLAACVVLAINEYWGRARAEKSRHKRCASLLTTLVKFIEYSWLHNRYDLAQWDESDYLRLAGQLAKGGWQFALDIRSRLINYCKQASEADLKLLIESDSGIRQKNINTSRFQAALGTNVQGREPKIYLHALRKLISSRGKAGEEVNVGDLFDDVVDRAPSASMLRNTFEGINYLYDLPLSAGVSKFPFKSSHTTAKKLGKPIGRTKNIGADETAKLLAEAFRWIYQYGPSLSALITELCDVVVCAYHEGRQVLGSSLETTLLCSPNRARIETALPAPLSCVDIGKKTQGVLSVRSALLCLYSACFLVIAIMNARRRDEVSHRRFGVHQGFIHVRNAELHLYEAEFYIEKTYCDYLSFYVNRVTYDASRLLEDIQAAFDKVDRALGRRQVDAIPKRERTLFSYRRFSRIEGVGEKRCWFNFETRAGGAAEKFIRFALGAKVDLVPTPHMFRRMYALIFYYQYSNCTLQALSQQMQHAGLATTMIYVTDPWFIDDAKRISEKIKVENGRRRHAFDVQIRAVKKQITMVSDEVLVETIMEILSGQPTIGGYSRFIRFVYSRLSREIDFVENSLNENIKTIAATVKSRGHSPTPMRHGQCMAGSTTSIHLARCKKEGGTLLQREHASAITCAQCAYHYSNERYLRNLREDLKCLNDTASIAAPLERELAKHSAKNLARIIELHEARIAIKNDKHLSAHSRNEEGE